MTMVAPEDFPTIMEVEVDPMTRMPRVGCPPVGVAFGYYPLKDIVKSENAGHDVFLDVVHVRITVPGDTRQIYFQPANESYQKRFPVAWKAFQDRAANTERVEGLPIDQWAAVTRSVALTLRAANVPTVEALAAVHEGHVEKIPNGRELRAKAIAFLEQAKGSAAAMKDAKEKQELRDQIAALTAQLASIAGKGIAAPDAETVPDAVEAARKSKKKAA